eukprot:583634-Prymnesium_polylepis.1
MNGNLFKTLLEGQGQGVQGVARGDLPDDLHTEAAARRGQPHGPRLRRLGADLRRAQADPR